MEILNSIGFGTDSVRSCNMPPVWLFEEWITSNCSFTYWMFYCNSCYSSIYILLIFQLFSLLFLLLSSFILSCKLPSISAFLTGSSLLIRIKSRKTPAVPVIFWWSCAVFVQRPVHWERLMGAIKKKVWRWTLFWFVAEYAKC